jgi:hypothetical protein
MSSDRKNELQLRVISSRDAAQAVSGTRGAVVSGGPDVTDEAGLGIGAHSERSVDHINVIFAVEDKFVTVMLEREPSLGDADAQMARTFSQAVTEELR